MISRMGNHFLRIYDFGRLRDENLSGTFCEQLNIKLDGQKFDNVEDGWNNFRKISFEVAS